MSNIPSMYINALLADAAYVDGLADGMSATGLEATLGKRMTPTIAKFVAGNFEVVAHKDSGDFVESGFDATVWRGRSSTPYAGQVYVSMRGTEAGLQDYLADVNLALPLGAARDQLVDMVNWWNQITTPTTGLATQIQQTPGVNPSGIFQYFLPAASVAGTGLLTVFSNVQVNGHSLGGHLASAFARIFGDRPGGVAIDSVTTFNSAGFSPGSELVFKKLESALGIGGTTFKGSKQTNVFAQNGISVTTNSFYFNQIGKRLPVFNEEGAPHTNHFMYKLTDALALGDLMAKVDPTLTIELLNSLLAAGTNDANKSLEFTLDSLRRLIYGVDVAPTLIGDADNSEPSRMEYYFFLDNLRKSSEFSVIANAGNVQFRDLLLYSNSVIASTATNGAEALAYRYALKELNPFAIVGNESLYAPHNKNGELALYDPARGQGLTESWIRDRAGLLQALLISNTKDNTSDSIVVPGIGILNTEYHYVANNKDNKLIAKPSERTVAPLFTETLSQYVAFADDKSRTLTGTNNALGDRLYGGAGNDTLNGLSGSDYLEGGKGNDTYMYVSGANSGIDTILDSDKLGKIVYSIGATGFVLSGGKRENSLDPDSKVWISDNKKFRYELFDNGQNTQDLRILGPNSGVLVVKDFTAGELGIKLQDAATLPTTAAVNTGTIVGTTDSPEFMGGGYLGNLFVGGPGTEIIDGDYGDDTLYADVEVPIAQFIADGNQSGTGLQGSFLNGGPGKDTVVGSTGNDALMGGGSDDILLGGAGDDVISGDTDISPRSTPGHSAFDWGYTPDPGDPFILNGQFTGIGNNFDLGSLFPGQLGDGNDQIYAGGGNDFVAGGGGNDTIFGEDGNDVVRGGEGNDIIYGGKGDDMLTGEEHGYADAPFTNVGPFQISINVHYVKSYGDDFIDGGDGNDLILGEGGNDVLLGGAGDDTIYGDINGLPAALAGKDYLNGGKGNDFLLGGDGNDVYDFSAGDGIDEIQDTSGIDTVILPANLADLRVAMASDNPNYLNITYGTGDMVEIKDGLKGAINYFKLNDGTYSLAQILKKLTTNVTVSGTDPAGNTLYGGSGDDTISATTGDNTFQAGDGANTINGGNGKDQYVFSRFSAQDTIRDSGGGQDSIQLIGLAPEEITVQRDARSFLLASGATLDFITILDGYIDPTARVESVEFDDGTVWDYNELVARAEVVSSLGGIIIGTPQDDVLTGTNNPDWIYGLEGNDIISGLAGKDTIDGGAGDDVIDGGAGDDTITGGAGNDTIDGGTGNDNLDGGAGSDTYIVQGAGNKTIVDDDSNASDIDTLILPQLAPNQISATSHVAGDNIVLRFGSGATSGTITLPNTNDVNSSSNIEQIVFSDDSVWNHAALLAHTMTDPTVDGYIQSVAGSLATPYQTAINGHVFTKVIGDDFYSDNRLAGSDAKDTLYGAYGNDTITGGLNDDRLYGGAGNDTLDGGEGDDLVDGGNGSDTVYGGAGADIVVGGFGDDVLAGGQGNDVLYGGDGYDTYVFNLGDGTDTLIDSTDTSSYTRLVNPYLGIVETVTGAPNKVVFGASITLDMVTAAQPGTFVTPAGVTLRQSNFNIGAGDDSLMLVTARGDGPAVRNFQFADGSAYTFDQLVVLTTRPGRLEGSNGPDIIAGSGIDDRINGRGGNDFLLGGGGNDTILGGKGDDYLEGDAGADTLDGGPGNDHLEGGTGDDSYLFARGDGIDTIVEDGSAAGGSNSVRLAADVLASDVTLTRDAQDNLLITIHGTADVLKVQGYFTRFSVQGHAAAPNARIDQIVFGDGAVLSAAAIDARLGGASNGDDYVLGTAGDDVLNGFGGNDVLFGAGGDDTLDGGAGNDLLDGGAGNDRYRFGRGAGEDTIVENDATAGDIDTVQLANDVLPGDVTLRRDFRVIDFSTNQVVDDLVLSINGSSDQLTIKNYFVSDAAKIERIVFGDGTELNSAQLDAVTNPPTDAADVLLGTPGNDTLDGLGGDDQIYGFSGDDTLAGGEGFDLLTGGNGNDTLLGGAGIDTLDGGAGDDVLDGGDETDVLFGGDGNDVLTGGAGDDFLNGDAGDDFLSGGAGDDQLSGGDGNDVLFGDGGNNTLNGDAGDDALVGGDGNDTLDGGAGNDTLTGGAGDDVLQGGPGNDRYVLARGGGADSIFESDPTAGKLDTLLVDEHILASDVVVTKNAANDLLLSVAGTSDQMRIEGYFVSDAQKIERIEFGDGTVWDTAYIASLFSGATEFDDVIDGNAGDDVIDGLGGNDRITGGAGNDRLIGGRGNDFLSGDDGNDTLIGGSGNDTLNGGNGNDTYVFARGDGRDVIRQFDTAAGRLDQLKLSGGILPADVILTRDTEGNMLLNLNGSSDRITFQNWYAFGTSHQLDRMVFDNGVVWNAAAIEDHRSLSMFSGFGQNQIFGTSAGEVLTGLAGTNQIFGFGGDDTLQGRQFSDTLDGGSGSDTYLFGRGDGRDTIIDTAAAGDLNRVMLGANITPANISMTRDNSNLYLNINGSNDRLTLQGWYTNNAFGVQQVVFANGMLWDVSTLQALANVPTQGDDFIIGTAGDDVIYGLGGNDYIDGQGGNNTLSGGAGFDFLTAADGDNVFDGGADDDYLAGGGGNDVYLFGHGSDNDTLYDSGFNYTIRMAADVTPDQVTVAGDPFAPDNLVLTLGDSSESIIIQSWFSTLDFSSPQVVFADGSVWDSAELQNRTQLAADQDFGRFFAPFNFSELTGLSGSNGESEIQGGVGLTELFGSSADDSFDQLASGNVLYGGLGSDSYEVNRGDGRLVTIVETPHLVDGVVSADDNRIVFSAGITPDSLTIVSGSLDQFRALDNITVGGTYDPTDLVIGHDNLGVVDGGALAASWGGVQAASGFEGGMVETGSVLSRTDFPFGNAYGIDEDRVLIKDGTLGRIQTYQFADGTVWTQDQIMSYLAQETDGTSGNDTLTGRFGSDIIVGNEGDDVISGLESGDYLYGGDGNDTINGGAGVDYLDGGEGNDALRGGTDGDYLFGQAGNDQIYGGDGFDHIEGGVGNDFIDGGDGADRLDGGDGNDVIYGGHGNDYIQGDTYHTAPAFFGTSFYTIGGNDELHGGTGDDVIFGLDGTDTLYGDDGNDTLHGGNQDDFLDGGAGDDLLFGDSSNVTGYGNDLLDGGVGADDMRGGAGNDTYVVDNVGDLVTELQSEGIDLVQSSITYTLTANIENLTLTGANVIDGTGNTLDNIIIGNSAANVLTAFGGNDRIDGAAGADTMFGGTGNDTYVVDNQGDLVTENANEGTDTVESSISYTLTANVENLTLIGNAAIDGTGNSLVNIFIGNSANNVFTGGDGSDVYHFGKGSGQDTVIDASTIAGSTDAVQIDAGVNPNEVTLIKDGDDLRLRINHTQDRLTVKDWFKGVAYQVEQINFSNGVVWNSAFIQSVAGPAPVNNAPILGLPIADVAATENQSFSFQVPANTFLDTDIGDSLLYAATRADGSALPAWLTFNPNNRTFSGIPHDADVDTLSFKVQVTDVEGMTVSDTFDVVIADVNNAPTVANFIPDVVTAQNAAFSYQIPANTFTDADTHDNLTYAATRADSSALPGWVAFDAVTRTLRGTPSNGDVGPLSVKISATDSGGLFVTDVFQLTVTNVNDAPSVANAIVDRFADVDLPFEFSVPANTFADIDSPYGDILTKDVNLIDGTPLPDWLSFDVTTNTFSGTPAGADAGLYSIKVMATDSGGLSTTDTFDLTVNAKNAQTVIGTAGDDLLSGGAGNDVLIGGAGNDTLSGGAGNDTYVFNSGDGIDHIVDSSGTNTISFGKEIAEGSLTLDLGSLLIHYGAGADAIHIDVFNPQDVFSVPSIAKFNFSNGDSLSFAQLIGRGFDLHGTTGDDVIFGTNVADRIRGFSGNDVIDAGAGDDVLDGGSDNDRLIGGAGNDRYVFGFGGGSDRIDEAGALATDFDTIELHALPGDVTVSRNGGDVVIALSGGSDKLTVNNFDAAGNRIEAVHFSDGTLWDRAQLFSAAAPVNHAPTLSSVVGDQSALEDAAFSFTLPAREFADGDAGDTLRLSASRADGSALPSWLSFNATTQTFDGIPVNSDVGTVSLRVIATDSAGATASDFFNLAVINTNDAPTLAIDIGDQSTLEDAAFSFTLPASEFADVDVGDSLTLSATRANGSALPSWLSFDGATRTFFGTPVNADVGTVALKVVATDRSGATSFDTLDLSVINTNDAPTLAIDVGDQSTLEDAAFIFTLPAGEFADVDVGDTLAMSASRADGSALPSWLSFDAAMRTFAGIPANADVDTVALKVVATDGAGATTFDTFNLSIINTNDAPTLAIDVGDQSTLEDAAFIFTLPAGEFADVDVGDTLALSASRADGSALPSWLSFDAATRTFAGIPVNADVGTVALKVVATDGAGATAFDTFNLSVINTNDAPMLAIDAGDQSTLEDAAFSFALPASEFADVDAGDSLTLSATRADGSALPSWLLFNAATRTFAGTPLNGDVGTVGLMILATDGAGATAFDTFNLSIINTNDAPVAAGDSFTILENAVTGNLAPAMLANDADPDIGDTRRVSAVNTSGTLGIVSFNATAQSLTYASNGAAFDALRAGVTITDSFSYTVADAAGAASSATVAMTVTGINDAPVLGVQTVDQAATAGTLFSLTLAANTFADVDIGDTLTYAAQLSNGAALPSWLSFNPSTRTFAGTAASFHVGNYAIKVTATDTDNASAFEVFNLAVAAGSTGQTLIGTAGNDTLTGGAGDDTLNGLGGSDRLVGNGGNDRFQYFADGSWSSGFVALNAGSPGNPGTNKTAPIAGKGRSFDVFEGGAGNDALIGTSGNDAIFLDDLYSAFPNGIRVPRIAGIERIEGGAGDDVIDLTSDVYAYGNVMLDGGDGNDVLWASSGDDILLGGAGNDDLFGGAGNDYLAGDGGNDTLNGDRGNDLLEGGEGNDTLTDTFGRNLFYGKDGNDSLSGGDGAELFIGGAGNDVITTAAGFDIIAFNRGDGHDTVAKSTALDNTVSLGGGIRYGDLFLSKQGNNLVLQTAANEDLTLTDWYAGSGNRSVLNLQMIVEASADYAPGGADVLRDNKVERFDFSSIVQRFDQARVATPSVANHWAVTNALLDAHLGNGSDTEALGGDLAYRYGGNGTLAGIGNNSAQAMLAGSQFGSAPQGLQPFSGLQDGLVKLG